MQKRMMCSKKALVGTDGHLLLPLTMVNPQQVAGTTVCLGAMSPKTFRLLILFIMFGLNFKQ